MGPLPAMAVSAIQCFPFFGNELYLKRRYTGGSALGLSFLEPIGGYPFFSLFLSKVRLFGFSLALSWYLSLVTIRYHKFGAFSICIFVYIFYICFVDCAHNVSIFIYNSIALLYSTSRFPVGKAEKSFPRGGAGRAQPCLRRGVLRESGRKSRTALSSNAPLP